LFCSICPLYMFPSMRGRRGRDRIRMVAGFPTTCAISAYNNENCEFESRSWWGVLDTTLCYKVCQWLVTDLWFSPGTPVTSTNETDRHDVAEISLKVALNTINQTKPRDQWAKYGFIRGVTSADVMCYIIRHYRLRFIFNLLSANMPRGYHPTSSRCFCWWTISPEVTTRPVVDTSPGGLLVPRLPSDQ
jgi:hypothetical protein